MCSLGTTKGLPPNMSLSQRLPRRYTQNADDIFCLIKHQLRDEELSQDALLVLPGDEKRRMGTFLRDIARHEGILSNIDPQRQQDLLELSDALAGYPQYSRAVHYYRTLAGVEYRKRVPVYPLTFLQTSGVQEQGLVCATLRPREATPKPHPLRVRFHRS